MVKDIPVRVETPLAKLMAKQAQTPNPPRPATPASTPSKREDIHPSIQASLACLVIVAVISFVSLIVLRQNMFAALAIFYMTTPFIAAAPFCAIYGMCIGHVKHGLLLLGAMGLMAGLFYWVALRESQAAVQDFQRQMEQRLRQIPKFPR